MKNHLLSPALLLLLLLALPLSAFGKRIVTPPALRPGDEVILITPASHNDSAYIWGLKARLESWGLKVRIAPHAFSGSKGHYAGTTEERLSDLQQALDDPTARAIFCTRGGYGAVHLLDKLQFKAFRKNPKWLIGYSDITALHNLLQANGFASIHAPMGSHLTNEPADDPAVLALKNMLFQEQPTVYTVPGDSLNHPGQAQGILRGGNLSVFYGLRATPWDIPGKGTILYMEDVGERPHSIERMVCNLRLSGLLDRISGLIIGQFTEYKEDLELGKPLYPALADLVRDYDYPICFGFPVGHVTRNYPLVNGARVELTVSPTQCVLRFE